MNREKITALLAKIIEKEAAELASVSESTPLSDLGLDSIKFIQFIVAFEEEYDIEIRDSDLLLSNFETLERLFQTLQTYFTPTKTLKKVLVCDCDNVLWHGVAGEEELTVDEINRSFQEELIRLYRGGTLLCLCSRNEPTNIDAAFEQLDMPLCKEHIVCSHISRNDKASELKALAEELNLSLDSFVFVDDSDYELGLVNALLPEVETVKADYADASFIDAVKILFGNPGVQDSNRTQLYREQKKREKDKHRCATVEEYNNSLETMLTCETAAPEQAERLAELSQRTNQCNLADKRYTKEQVESLLSDTGCLVLSLSVADKYGDMGIVGAAVVRLETAQAMIEAFFLSCRAFDRGFETVLLEEIKKRFSDRAVAGIYVPTGKNGHYSRFYEQNGVTSYAP